jgi:hypothetical protein
MLSDANNSEVKPGLLHKDISNKYCHVLPCKTAFKSSTSPSD